MKYIKYNENIALAKAILRRNNIDEKDVDYLKIREIVGTDYSYVGILTRLRFIDNVTDFDELKSIYDVLKNSKIDLGKINKMSYDQILDTFYDELSTSNNEDYELVFKDKYYSYFKVYTYKGILEIGSPAWCLKTKTNWDSYQSKFPDQYVIIDNDYVKSIITPNNLYLGSYTNDKKPWIRYGISINPNDNGNVRWIANDDNNGECKHESIYYTFIGVFFTVLNLVAGIKKSHLNSYPGCEPISDREGWFLVKDTKKVSIRLKLKFELGIENDKTYLIVAYNRPTIILRLRDNSYPYMRVLSNNDSIKEPYEISPNGRGGQLIKDFVTTPQNCSYSGIRIKLGYTTIEECKSQSNYVTQVNDWLVFEWNSNYYLAVNSKVDNYIIPVSDINNVEHWTSDGRISIFSFIDKKTYSTSFDIEENTEIIRKLKLINKGKDPEQEQKRSFLGFKY